MDVDWDMIIIAALAEEKLKRTSGRHPAGRGLVRRREEQHGGDWSSRA